ncbi:hypothetical protein PUR49_32550 [Streptomyces sp. BE147]|uniref:hypothetical protein n=1 Tax=Streptomyces sp. BE147 TaxID=3002524 RepID=UPI002E7A6347|nr:hypothetical protein [Streptomyces sp. BE147]MEE1741203.1 hypothetical protein [Streptomyces sp. BE147]
MITDRTLFEPAFEDNPGWEGAQLYDDLATAQKEAGENYLDDVLENADTAGLSWRSDGTSGWDLLHDGEPTPVSITTRTVRRTHPGDGRKSFSAEEQLALASEFRFPLQAGSVGGYSEVVVQRDGSNGRFAVTDGALTGLQAWVDGEGWRRVADVGRAAAFSRTREEAFEMAHHVAELEGSRHQRRISSSGRLPR